MKKKRVLLNDVMLREAAQVEGGAMSPDDQLKYVKLLLENEIDRMEIGFPGSSKDQLKQCIRIVRYVKKQSNRKKSLLSGLARALEKDIDAVKRAGCDICHIYIPVSDSLMMAQFNAKKYGNTPAGTKKWVIDQAVKMVQYAKRIGFKQIEFSPEDAARTSQKFLVSIVEAVISAGVDIVNIPDTTGLRIGTEFGDLIREMFKRVPSIDKAIISVHCHNDSDHATANALQAILAGAEQVEGTFYGLGERSGMTKFESIIMNVNTRKDIFKHIIIGFNKNACLKIVDFVGSALGMPVPRHWPVVGLQNKICSSGSHQAIEARAQKQGKKSAYYSWRPELYGHDKVEQVIGQFSGKEGLKGKLEKLGYQNMSPENLESIFVQVKKLSSARLGAAVSSRELTAIIQDVIAEIPYPIIVEYCQVIGGKGTIPTATVTINADGKTETVAEIGDGPFDAIMKAVRSAAAKAYPILGAEVIVLDDWRPIPITRGTGALADVYARIRVKNSEDSVFSGRAVDLDTSQASAQAFANCLSWYLASVNK